MDGERASWRDGEAMVFDETYVHEAFNGSDMTRLILFCDVERPVRGPWQAVNRWMIHHVMGATGAPNEVGEQVGAVNRFFERIYGVMESGKALKAKNRRLYYALKYALISLLLVVVIL